MGLARAWRLAAAALVGRFADARPVGALELRLQAPAANACVLLAWGGLCRARGFPLRSSDEGSSSAFETLLPSGHVRLGVTLLVRPVPWTLTCSLDPYIMGQMLRQLGLSEQDL